MFQNVEEAREFFKNDRFATGNGMIIEEIGDDYAVTSVELTPEHMNAAGGVMGGVQFTLADFAFAVISNHIHLVSVALTTSITFLSAVKGDKLYARCQLVKDGRTTGCYQTEVTDNTGRHVATLNMNVFKK